MMYDPVTDHHRQQSHLVLDSATKQSKGLAYISFANPDAALEAYEALDKTSFQGRLLHILPAVDRRGIEADAEGEGKKKTLKQDREGKRKAMAGKEFNWAMLYMNVRTYMLAIYLSLLVLILCLSERCGGVFGRRPYECLESRYPQS